MQNFEASVTRLQNILKFFDGGNHDLPTSEAGGLNQKCSNSLALLLRKRTLVFFDHPYLLFKS